MMRRAALPCLIGMLACTAEVHNGSDTPIDPFLSLSPLEPLPIDPTNRFFEDPEAAAFGEQLFFDTRLSATGEVACSTCHQPEHGFADPRPLSEAIGTTRRHTPSLLNVGWNRWFYWDGRADSLWAQALSPLENPDEHGFSRLEVLHLIAEDEALSSDYRALFGPLPPSEELPRAGRPTPSEPDNPAHIAWSALSEAQQQGVNTVFVNVGKSLAAYQRTLIRRDAPFDRFVDARRRGDPDGDAILGEEAILGLELFVGDAGCMDCHSGPTFSDLQFHNIGLPTATWMDPSDVGRYDGILRVISEPFNGTSVWSDDREAGEQKLRYISHDEERLGQFKTPSLRNVALTAPYMHSGQLETLDDVVQYYNQGGGTPAVGHREETMRPLNLTKEEQAALVAFLESLTGEAPDET